MSAQLVGIAGPLKGAVYPLNAAEFLLGRDPSNAVCLDDESVSRCHCEIVNRGGKFRITDRSSHNGTFVNGEAVTEKQLESGDEVRLGASTFVFIEGAGILPPQPSSDPEPETETQTVVLRTGESLYLRRDAAAADTHSADALAALLRTSNAMARLRDPREILQLLGAVTAELHPAAATHVTYLDQSGPGTSAEELALHDTAAVLEDRRTLVVPLTVGSKVVALFRLEAEAALFNDSDLHYLCAVGAIASLALENATHMEFLEGENRRLRSEGELQHQMVGDSSRIQEVLRLIAKVAPSVATVFIQGESGTGKELVARAIHANSPRASKPFVAINCAALNENLLESELFGHEKGAFTGAIAQKRGKMEIAEGGTLFLDEIGEMALGIQAKLLRVLQEREFERVGGTRTLRADLRVIAASNRNLPQAVQAGTFRNDLYYRLNVVTISTPALRERREDIPALANFFVARFAARAGRAMAGISPAARACLVQYDWPGNVRELENAVERAVVLGSTDLLHPEDLPEAVLEAAPEPVSGAGYHHLLREGKKKIILGAMERARGNQTEAANLLGLNPTYLSRLIRNLELRD